jgi:transcription termination factor Rho
MANPELADRHLADLHALAAELGVPGFRLLRRPELIAEIEAREGQGKGRERDEAAEAAPEREPRRRRPRRRQRERLAPEPEEGGEDEEPAADEPTEQVTGVLEITRQRYGFVRLRGLEAGPDDVYISAPQVRRCELRPGDEVTGPARAPRRGERHRALVHVDSVNGAEPQAPRPSFEELTPILPRRRVALDRDRDDVLLRAVDLLAPLALGQRVLVSAAPRSGRTTLLRRLARALAASGEAEPIVLLVDERPEEATAWREALPEAAIAAATAELAPTDQVRLAELALDRARRRVESGVDVVLLVDSLSRLAVAAGDVAVVKHLFGSGRDLAEDGAGSLTVVATVVDGADDGGDAERAVATTETSLIALDPDLAAAGVYPALRPSACRTSGEEELRDSDELDAVRRLRSLLADPAPAEAVALLRERIEGSATNAELLSSI